MANFLHVGRQWINLELVERIELFENKKEPGRTAMARIHYVNSKHIDFQDADSIAALETFLENHQAR